VPVRLPKEGNPLLINAGDIIQRWTNDRWHSPLHRVVGNARHLPHTLAAGAKKSSSSFQVGGGGEKPVDSALEKYSSRWTLVFFSGPLADCVVEVLPSTVVTGPDRPALYAPVRSGDYLAMKLNRTN
jgi:isopenicillin N synthase-like dioxygenase